MIIVLGYDIILAYDIVLAYDFDWREFFHIIIFLLERWQIPE